MGRVAAIERILAVVAVAATVLAMVLAVEVRTAPGTDRWTEGAAGAWLWLWCGVVPVVVAALVAVVRRRRGSARLLLGAAVAVALSTALGEAMHVVEPGFDRHVVGAVGAGLDVV